MRSCMFGVSLARELGVSDARSILELNPESLWISRDPPGLICGGRVAAWPGLCKGRVALCPAIGKTKVVGLCKAEGPGRVLV